MGRGPDIVVELGMFRIETYGSVAELMERQGGYRLSLYGKHDRDVLRALLDRLDEQEAYQPVLALEERERAAS